jgi:fructose-bisphosphate aldolase class I
MDNEKYNVIRNKKGFVVALDQSGGSSPKTLMAYGVSESQFPTEEKMFDLINQMRIRIIKSPNFSGEYIIGTILFEKTMEIKINDEYVADYLWKNKDIVSFLKIDKGLIEIENGVQLMKEITDLDGVLDKALKRGMFGTKMRSVIREDNEEGIKKLVEQQFKLAKKIIEKDLVPIVEPEVDINAANKERCEELLKIEINRQLQGFIGEIILKLTVPSIDNFYEEYTKHQSVIRVIALSGGYSRDVACAKLSKNRNIIASFSRAFTEGLKVSQSENDFDNYLKMTIESIYESSVKKI